jgi:hypothetical protein
MAVEKKFVPGKGLVPVGKEEAGKKGAVPPAKGKGKDDEAEEDPAASIASFIRRICSSFGGPE